MTAENESLEAAAQALHQAQDVLHAACRKLTEAILHAYADGEPVSRIARRTGRTSTDVWNTLAVHGITRSTHLNGSPPA